MLEELKWWSGIVVVHWSRSIKLTYIGPSKYWNDCVLI